MAWLPRRKQRTRNIWAENADKQKLRSFEYELHSGGSSSNGSLFPHLAERLEKQRALGVRYVK